MRPRSLALIFLLLPVSCIALRAEDWYVDNVGGVDSLASYRLGQNLRTIQFALSLASPGDRIILKKNQIPYREEISVSGAATFGLSRLPIELLGNGAVLEGAEKIPDTQWEYVGDGVFRYLPRLVSYQVLFLDGKPARKQISTGAGPASLQPLEWTQYEGWIYFRTEPGKAPFQYPTLSCCARAVGITLYQTRNVRISDLVVQGFQLDGINAADLAENVQVVGCTFRGNGRSGVCAGGVSQLGLQGCLIGDNGHSQVRCEGLAQLGIESCDVIEQEGTRSIDHQGGRIVRDGQSFRQ